MKKLLFIIAAILLGLMASCKDEVCPIEAQVEVDNSRYYFKALERYTRLEYNADGALVRTHAQETILSEETGITLKELTILIETYDQEIRQEITDQDVKTWTITLTYNLIRP